MHIDFGFMLSNRCASCKVPLSLLSCAALLITACYVLALPCSPGGVNFEAAPFKLTRELLEVMDSNSEGRPSELFDYFKVLLIQGFLACRKHHERLLLLVRGSQGWALSLYFIYDLIY